MGQSQPPHRSDTEAALLPHARFRSYSFFLALAPRRFVRSGDVGVEICQSSGFGVGVEICQSSGFGVGNGRSWIARIGLTWYIYLPLDPAPDRMVPDFLSIGKLC